MSDEGTTSAFGGELLPVVLLELPVQVWSRAENESKDLMREFALIVLNRERGHVDVPSRLLELMDELDVRYGSLGGEQLPILEHARAEGIASVDRLDYMMPPSIVPDVQHLAQLMDEADDYCRAGEHLLSLASTPAAKAFRDWLFEEIYVQLGGGEPTPWPQSRFAALAREAVAE